MDDLRKLAEAEIEARKADCHTWAWDNAATPDRILKLLDVVEKASGFHKAWSAGEAGMLGWGAGLKEALDDLSGAGTRTASDE